MKKPNRCSEVIVRDENDKAILFDSRSGAMYLVNSTAGFVWSLCDGSKDLEEIIGLVKSRFGGKSYDVDGDVTKLIGRFSELGLITIAEG